MLKIDKLINDINNVLVNIHNIFLLHNNIIFKNLLFDGTSSFLPRINILQKHDMLVYHIVLEH